MSRQAPSPNPAPADGESPPALITDATEHAALRDAEAVAARISADEAAADAERARLAREPLPRLVDGIDPATHLRADEVVHAVRHGAMLEHGRGMLPSGGTLYVTSRRVIHLGEQTREVALTDIAETGVALERLLLVDLADGTDMAVEVDQPRLLRVQLAAARAAARAGAG